jgi:hypothetical protein
MGSFVHRYTVRPEASVRNVPFATVFVVITVLAFDVPAGLAPAWDPEPVLLLLLLHAAASSATAASGIPALAATGIRAGDKLVMIISVPRHRRCCQLPRCFPVSK